MSALPSCLSIQSSSAEPFLRKHGMTATLSYNGLFLGLKPEGFHSDAGHPPEFGNPGHSTAYWFVAISLIIATKPS